MDPAQIVTLIVFVTVITAIVMRVFDEALIAIVGVATVLLLGVVPYNEAFGRYVDWNVILILLGMWIISHYLVKGGLPRVVVSFFSKYGRSYDILIILLAFAAGLISMFVDNVLVILLFVPIIIGLSKASNLDPVKPALIVTLSANFMGTALLLGDIPPQLLHSIAGAEFLDFIISQGKPSSLPILLGSFTLTIITMRYLALKTYRGTRMNPLTGIRLDEQSTVEHSATQSKVLKISFVVFLSTVILMSLRRELEMIFRAPLNEADYTLKLGYIPLIMATILVLIMEKCSHAVNGEELGFKGVIKEIQWDTLLFYISLFILVGSLEYRGVIEAIASGLEPIIGMGIVGHIAFYWISALFSGFVEHDAYILTMLYTLRELHDNGFLLNPWPYYWNLVWAATLGSNLTIAGAPAIYVAVAMLRSRGYKVGPREILSITAPFTLTSLTYTYLIALPIWFS